MRTEKYILNLKSFSKMLHNILICPLLQAHNSLCFSILFLSENPTHSEFKWPCIKGGGGTQNKSSHKDQILYTLKKKNLQFSPPQEIWCTLQLLSCLKPWELWFRDGRQKESNRDSHSIFYLNFLKNSEFKRSDQI